MLYISTGTGFRIEYVTEFEELVVYNEYTKEMIQEISPLNITVTSTVEEGEISEEENEEENSNERILTFVPFQSSVDTSGPFGWGNANSYIALDEKFNDFS